MLDNGWWLIVFLAWLRGILLSTAKLRYFFELSKKNALLCAFFSLEDAASRYYLKVIGWDLPEWDSGLMDKERAHTGALKNKRGEHKVN